MYHGIWEIELRVFVNWCKNFNFFWCIPTKKNQGKLCQRVHILKGSPSWCWLQTQERRQYQSWHTHLCYHREKTQDLHSPYTRWCTLEVRSEMKLKMSVLGRVLVPNDQCRVKMLISIKNWWRRCRQLLLPITILTPVTKKKKQFQTQK